MRVKFYGALQQYVPPGIEDIDFAVNTVKECIEAVTSQIPALRTLPRKVVQVLGVNNEHDLLRTDMDVVHIVPAFVGGKRGGLVQIVIGGLLIAASFLPGLTPFVATFLFNAGVALALGGLAALLAPKPSSTNPSSATNPEGSKYLGARGNTTRIGTRIPLAYGRQRLYGHILSYNVTAADVVRVGEEIGVGVETGTFSLKQNHVNLSADNTVARAVLKEASGGASPYTYRMTNLGSLTFNPSTRTLSARAGLFGVQSCTYTATDADNTAVSVSFTVAYDTEAISHGGGP